MPYPKDDSRAAWLWDFLVHSENIFTNRINFFLVAQSMLLVSYAALVNVRLSTPYTILVIAILGFCFTLGWLYVNGRAFSNMGELTKRVRQVIDEYKEIQTNRPCIPANIILAYALPICILIAWILLIILALL